MADLSGFFSSWEPQPVYVPMPQDGALAQRISKLAQFAARNGPSFIDLMKEKQKNNPEYLFLMGGEGADYWRWVLYCGLISTNPDIPAPGLGQTTYQPYTEPMHVSHYPPPGAPPQALPFVQPLPPDIDSGFTQVLDALSGSKESIKTSKEWFIKCGPERAPALAQRMAGYAAAEPTYSRVLHLIYLANDVLLKAAADAEGMGTAAASDPLRQAFLPVLPGMLAGAYSKGGSSADVADRLTTILDFWQERKVYDAAAIAHLKQSIRQPPVSPQPVASVPLMPVHQQHPVAPSRWGAPPGQAGMGPQGGMGPTAGPPPFMAQAPMAPFNYAPPDMGQPAWQQPPGPYPGGHVPPPGMGPGPMWGVQQHGHPMGMGMDMQYGNVQPPPGWYPPHGPPGMPNLAPPLHYPPPPVPPAGPPPINEAPPTDPFSFPPGLIPKLVRDKLEVDEPYSPLSPLDVEREGLPPPEEPDAYLSSRLDKFYAELQDYRAGMSRVDEEEKQKRAARLSGEGPPAPVREHASTFEGSGKGKRSDGSFGGRRSREKMGPAGLGFSESGGHDGSDGHRVDDVYNSYRAGRSSAYKDAMARAQAAAAQAGA